MAAEALSAEEKQAASRDFIVGLLRGAGGALIFGIPMLMTMELWFLGFYMGRYRLLLLLALNMPMLVLLARRMGFEKTYTWHEALRDAVIAYGLGIATSGAVLVLLGIITFDTPPAEWVGKVALQAVPASLGAMLGRSQLGGQSESDADDDPDEVDTGYVGEIFLMAVGALFLSLNVAPTEEVILISYKMTPWHGIAAIIVSLFLMHGFVYAVSFRGTHELPEGTPGWHAFLRFTMPGYIVASVISIYVLWTFGRLDGIGWTEMMMSMIVMNFPASIGAASARLVL